VGGTTVNLIANALFDAEVHNRFKGNIYMLSGALKL
jgi:hypothetical protein